MAAEILDARVLMKGYIFDKMLRRLPQPVNDAARMKLMSLAERLEDVLFKSFTEEYRNLETLSSRVMALVERIQLGRALQHAANQGGPLPVQNGPPAAQMQNLDVAGDGIGLGHAAEDMDPEVLRARTFIFENIFAKMLQHHGPQPLSDAQKMRWHDIAKRVEDGIFKRALTEYKDIETLEGRTRDLVSRRLITRRLSQMSEPVNLSQRRTSASIRFRNN